MSFKHVLLSAATVAAGFSLSTPAIAGPDEYIGQIMLGGWNFCPRGSAKADGQLLSISQNSALFSLFGTMYGGDGRTTFGLPDLRGRAPIHTGQGPGLSNRVQGSKGGTETNTMTVAEMPPHNHGVKLVAEGAAGTTANPSNAMLSVSTAGDRIYGPDTAAAEVDMNAKAIAQSNVGGGQAQNNMQPYQAIMYCVVTQGIFPSRN